MGVTVQQILGNSTEGNVINLTRKIMDGIKLRQDRHQSMRRLSNLDLFHRVFFSVELLCLSNFKW